MKAYLERRYNHDGKQRVFSAGTFTTLQVKAAIKDVCRTHRVSPNITNYITAIVNDDVKDWTDLMKLAFKEKKVRDFIEQHWDCFEELRQIMFQPRAQGLHASAVITVPDTIKGEDVDSFDIIPIRKMDGLLVSELSGYDLDDLGLLKNDILATKELSKLHEMMNICNKEYNANITLSGIASGPMDEPKVYEIINKGLTQGIFQLSSTGMTRFIKSMHPENIEDITAANALFRPATLDSGAAGMYVDAKNGVTDPEYLWGTYEILKDTYGVAAYQEQYAALAREIGGLSLGDGVNLVKAISKKKVDKIRKFKDRFYAGAKKKGCPDEVANRIWSIIEGGASYGFNKCIAGDEYLMRPDKKTFVTIEEMYRTMHDAKWAKGTGHRSLHDKYKREGYGNGMSLFEDGRVYMNSIVDIQYSGVRLVYKVTLDNGKCIQLTDNHKCPTQRGNVMVKDMVVGEDKLYVCGDYEESDTMYRFTDNGRVKRGEKGYPAMMHTIVSIECLGEKPVYDIEMADPNHNFANSEGIITCNSHAASYGATAYVGAYIKALYPVAFYTVLLKWGKDENITQILSEMRELDNVTIAQPDINISSDSFETDYQTNEIYWSLLRVKFVGLSMVEFIVANRKRYGSFMDLEDFITRIFKHKFKKYRSFDDEGNEEEYKRCPVNARAVRNLIIAGAFDKVEHIENVAERYRLVQRAAEMLGFTINEAEIPKELRDKHWFWSQQQINLSGFGSVDYESIFRGEILPTSMFNYPYFALDNLQQSGLGDRKVGICATIMECEERSYKDKRTGEKKWYGKIVLQQNIDTATLVIWNDAWMSCRQYFVQKKDSIVIFAGNAKWSDYDEKNILQINKGAFIMNI